MGFLWDLFWSACKSSWSDMGTNGLGWVLLFVVPSGVVAVQARRAPWGSKWSTVRDKWKSELRDVFLVTFVVGLVVVGWEFFWNQPRSIRKQFETQKAPPLLYSPPTAPKGNDTAERAARLQAPNLSMQPKMATIDADGGFTVSLVNDGPDIVDAELAEDYFLAEKTKGEIHLYQLFHTEFPGNPIKVPIRRNQSFPIPIGFSPVAKAALKSETSSCGCYPLLGVKITVSYKRYEDGKDFKFMSGYGYEAQTGKVIYAPKTQLDEFFAGPVPETKEHTATLSEAVGLFNDKRHWVVPAIALHPGGEVTLGKP
jgi:hypothetical protein